MSSLDPQADLLDHRPGGGARLPQRVKRIAMLTAALVFAGLVAVSEPLSGKSRSPEPREPDRLVEQTYEPAPTSAPAILARHDFDLVRYGPRGTARLARIPPGTEDGRLWAVDDAGYPAVLYGVSQGKLFRIDASHGDLVADLGSVDRIVGTGPGAGELVLQIGSGADSTIAVIEAVTGDVLDREPFPGFDGAGGWSPRGVLSRFGVPGLVLTRPAGDGRNEIAIAWSEVGLASGFVPSLLERFGRAGRLLGLAEDWVLLLGGDCPSSSCRLTALSFTRRGAAMHTVRPPTGWSFIDGETGGNSHEVLVPVVKVADGTVHALARLVPEGDTALLLRDSIGLEPSGGVVAEPDGSVYFLRTDSISSRALARWSPVDLPHIVTYPELPRLPASARLVCVCD